MNKFVKGAMVLGLSIAMVGCSSNAASDDSDSKSESLSGTITAAGSSALKPLVDVAAEQFSNENQDVSITVDAGGSGEGLKQVADKTVTLGNSDVAAEEKLESGWRTAAVRRRTGIRRRWPAIRWGNLQCR